MPNKNKPRWAELREILSNAVKPVKDSAEYQQNLKYADCQPLIVDKDSSSLLRKSREIRGNRKHVVITEHSPEDLK